MENKTSTTTNENVIGKYDGKRVRIEGRLYVIRVNVTSEILVSMSPMQEDREYEVNTYMHLDDFPNANSEIKKAIKFIHKVADEIEASLKADFEVEA